MVYVIEKTFDVQVYNPAVLRTVNPALPYGIVCRPVGTIPERVTAETVIDVMLRLLLQNNFFLKRKFL